MAVKITKSELKRMIREALREELRSGATITEAVKPLKESKFSDCIVCRGNASSGWNKADAWETPFGLIHKHGCWDKYWVGRNDEAWAHNYWAIAKGELSIKDEGFTKKDIDNCRKGWANCRAARSFKDISNVECDLFEKWFEERVVEVFTKEGKSRAKAKAKAAALQQQIHQSEVADKKASYGNQLPTDVYIWDMYIDPKDKGTWCSATLYNGEYDGYVFETEDQAIQWGCDHLSELDHEGELDGYPDDYTVDAVAIPVSKVSQYTLETSNLEHLI